MTTHLFSSCLNAPRLLKDREKSGRVRNLLGALTVAVAAYALILPAPALAATNCQGLTLRVAGKARVDVVGLSAEGFSCTKATTVARQVAREITAGRSLNLSGATGIEIASTTRCSGCAAETRVSLGYPTGTINVLLRGAAKLPSVGTATIPFPVLPFPRIPDFPFPDVPTLPAPTIPDTGVTTV
jgi:hypothetical protein